MLKSNKSSHCLFSKCGYWLSIGLVWFGLHSCRLTLDPSLDTIVVRVQVNVDESLKTGGLPLSGTEVWLTDLNAKLQWKGITDAAGVVAFPNMISGNYKVTARRLIQLEAYQALTGIPVDTDIILNDSLPNVLLGNATTSQANLTLHVKPEGNWVLKQLYYAGSDTLNGAGIRDQFIELYNNSNTDLYADSLLIGVLQGVRSRTVPASALQTSGQYDWSKSPQMPESLRNTANASYVYAHTLLMIPGTGRQYKVKAGESIIVAQNAQNHKVGYTGTDGKRLVPKNPGLTVNLAAANFEVFLNKLPSDVDNPAVPNLKVIHTNLPDFQLDPQGRDAVVLLKTREDVTKWAKVATPDVPTVTATTPLQVQIPIETILDGVELQPNTGSAFPKKLPLAIDAAYQVVPKGAYSSQSLIRRTARTIHTRRILSDTQNSQTDFGYFSLAEPRGFQ